MRPSHRRSAVAVLFNNNYCCLFHRNTDYNGFIQIASPDNKKSRRLAGCLLFLAWTIFAQDFSLDRGWFYRFLNPTKCFRGGFDRKITHQL